MAMLSPHMCMQFFIDEFDEPQPFISMLSIAFCQFDVCSQHQVRDLAKKLGELYYNTYTIVCVELYSAWLDHWCCINIFQHMQALCS